MYDVGSLPRCVISSRVPEAQALHVSLNIDYLTYARRHMRVATNGKREVP